MEFNIWRGKRKSIAFFNDSHTGSLLGMVPRRYVDARCWHEGLTWLLARYEEWLDTVPDNLDVIALVGDLVDGAQRAQKGRESWSTDPILQMEAAIELLEPLLKKAKSGGKIYVARGSGYHDAAMGRHAEELAKDIGAEKFPDGFHSAWHVPIELGGVKFSVAHPISFAPVNKATPLYSEVAAAVSLPARQRPRAVIRGHVHSFAHLALADPDVDAWTLPCWELRTAYQNARSIYRGGSIHVGGLWLEVEDGMLIYDRDRHLKLWTVEMPEFMEAG